MSGSRERRERTRGDERIIGIGPALVAAVRFDDLEGVLFAVRLRKSAAAIALGFSFWPGAGMSASMVNQGWPQLIRLRRQTEIRNAS